MALDRQRDSQTPRGVGMVPPMIAKLVAASVVFAVGVFIAASVSLALLHIRRGGPDLRGVFVAGRFTTFLAAVTVWALAGLLYLLQSERLAGSELSGLLGVPVVAGWCAALGFWLAGCRIFSRGG